MVLRLRHIQTWMYQWFEEMSNDNILSSETGVVLEVDTECQVERGKETIK